MSEDEVLDEENERMFNQSELNTIVKTRVAQERERENKRAAKTLENAKRAEALEAEARANESDKRLSELVEAEQRLQAVEADKILQRLYFEKGGRSDSVEAAINSVKNMDSDRVFRVNDEGELEVAVKIGDKLYGDPQGSPERLMDNLFRANPGLIKRDKTGKPENKRQSAVEELQELDAHIKERKEDFPVGHIKHLPTQEEIARRQRLYNQAYSPDIVEDVKDKPKSNKARTIQQLIDVGCNEAEAEEIYGRGGIAIAKRMGNFKQ